MVAGRPSPAPLGPVCPAGSALGGGWGLLWPYRTRVFRWCLDAVLDSTNTRTAAQLGAPAAKKKSYQLCSERHRLLDVEARCGHFLIRLASSAHLDNQNTSEKIQHIS